MRASCRTRCSRPRRRRRTRARDAALLPQRDVRSRDRAGRPARRRRGRPCSSRSCSAIACVPAAIFCGRRRAACMRRRPSTARRCTRCGAAWPARSAAADSRRARSPAMPLHPHHGADLAPRSAGMGLLSPEPSATAETTIELAGMSPAGWPDQYASPRLLIFSLSAHRSAARVRARLPHRLRACPATSTAPAPRRRRQGGRLRLQERSGADVAAPEVPARRAAEERPRDKPVWKDTYPEAVGKAARSGPTRTGRPRRARTTTAGKARP